ncbi:hypothetical protein Tco_0033586 [Tanacetum coccineum]
MMKQRMMSQPRSMEKEENRWQGNDCIQVLIRMTLKIQMKLVSKKSLSQSISRDDLTELYRIVMNKYGMDGPEDKLEKGFWKCLRIMFEEPLSTDLIWSELGQQKIISAKGLTSPEQTATGKGISNPLMAVMLLQKIKREDLKCLQNKEQLEESIYNILRKLTKVITKRHGPPPAEKDPTLNDVDILQTMEAKPSEEIPIEENVVDIVQKAPSLVMQGKVRHEEKEQVADEPTKEVEDVQGADEPAKKVMSEPGANEFTMEVVDEQGVDEPAKEVANIQGADEPAQVVVDEQVADEPTKEVMDDSNMES